MLKHFLVERHAFKVGIAFLSLLIAVIYGCRKENSATVSSISDPAVSQAKAWYSKTFPVYAGKGGSLKTLSTTHDLSQWIQPDWDNPQTYEKNNESVIEMPVDPESKFAASIKLNKKGINPKYSRSYYLLIKGSETYDAYIITIVADSAYIGADMSKVTRNTYRKRDADFTGSVIYFTPRGAYLGGYGYKNGKILSPAETDASTQAGTPRVQSIKTNSLNVNAAKQECTDWYIVYYIDGVYWYDEYLTTTCRTVDDGQGDGSSGSGPPPPAVCPQGYHPGPPVTPPCIPVLETSVKNVETNTVNIFNATPPPPVDGGGMPPPPKQQCSKDPERAPCPPVATEDPCTQAKKLVQDLAFKAKMNDLKSKTNLNKEVGYYTNDQGAYSYVEGTPGTAGINFTVSGFVSSYIHTHYTGTFPTFSMFDVQAIYNLQKNGNIIDISKFTGGVVTASGTTYLMKVTDLNKFMAFCVTNFQSEATGKVLEQYFDFMQTSYMSRVNNVVTAYELALMKTLENAGITIMKGNSDFSSWNTMTKSGNTSSTEEIKITNCN